MTKSFEQFYRPPSANDGPGTNYLEPSMQQDLILPDYDPSEISIEIDHPYPEDLHALTVDELGARLAERMEHAKFRVGQIERVRGRPVTTSSGILVDDAYKLLGKDERPGIILANKLLPAIEIAEEMADFKLDYIAREAACAKFFDPRRDREVRIAEALLARLIAPPSFGTTGTAQPVEFERWHANGLRPRTDPWEPPVELNEVDDYHSVLVDVELYSEKPKKKGGIEHRYSCALLAAAWQLMRLGLMYYGREIAVTPEPLPSSDQLEYMEWENLPAVSYRHEDANPFDAYETLSLLPRKYLKTEIAVKTLITNFNYENEAEERMKAFALKRGLPVEFPPERREDIFTR